ncbi:MAG TPA: two-component regulator propeller domain-containing protein, partial [Flavisolibacter sp.]
MKNDQVIFEYPIPYTSDQMVIDDRGRLWVITRSDNLMLFTIQPGNEKEYLKLEKDFGDQLKEKSLRSIVIDRSGNVWLGTRSNGVLRLTFKDENIDSILQFTTRDGLSDNFIYSLACDQNNTLWIGTQNGLDRIAQKNGRYIVGNTGRVNNWFQTVLKLVTTPGGSIWALTSEGSILNLAAPGPYPGDYQPELAFTSVSVNNQPSGLLPEYNSRQNNFSFSVAAPSYIDEASIRYSFILEGSGINEWSQPTNLSDFHFINLSPGSYTLKVRSDFPEEMYPSKMISYSFLINPPWWQTWWFRIGFGFLILGFSVALVRYYYKRKMERQRSHLEKQKAIEKERTRIATDMHDDLGAGLSRIKFLSETIGLKKQQHQPIEEEISKIREYSHHMIDKMGEIVWALNEKNDSLSDLLSYTRAYAMEYLSQNGILCEVDMPENLQGLFVSGEFRRNIFLSVK